MVWEKVKKSLQGTIAANVFDLWIEPLQFEGLKGEKLYLSTPDRYFSAYVKQNFLAQIEKASQDNGLTGVQVMLGQGAPPKKKAKVKKKQPAPVQMRLPSVPVNSSKARSLHPRYTFDEFMVGESNILAQSACRSIVSDDGVVGPCLYINSDTGLGKSHLTHAVAHRVFQESPMTRLQYLTAKQFAAEMVRGIQNKTMDDFKRKYQENCDILLVEDIHALTGKKKTQEELNDVLDMLIKSGKRVILTSNSSPQDLVGIDSEFRSRMTAGLVTSIKAPDVKTRQRIIEKKACQKNLQLEDSQIEYLSSHIKGDIRKIESALLAVQARARLIGGEVDLALIKDVVSSVVGVSQTLTASMICDMVCGQFNVSVNELKSRSRKKIVTVPRQIGMYLSRKYTEESLAQIGKTFHRDHSTVLHSIKVVSNKLVRDTSVNAQLEILSGKVQQL